jgi:AbrB family looped-hinge helix DNA binding protein
MSQATVTSKGQITIPKEVRSVLHLESGGKVDFLITDNGDAIMRPLSKATEDVFGMLSSPKRRTITVKEMDKKLKNTFKNKWK